MCALAGMMTQLDTAAAAAAAAASMPQVSVPVSSVPGVSVSNNSATAQSQKLQQQRNDRLDVSGRTCMSCAAACVGLFVAIGAPTFNIRVLSVSGCTIFMLRLFVSG